MLWVIGLIFLFVLVFGPTLWVRWVIKAHSEDLEGVPGTGGELAEHLLTRLGGRRRRCGSIPRGRPL